MIPLISMVPLTLIGQDAVTGFRRADEVNALVDVYDGRKKEEIKTDVDKVTICLAKYRDAIKWRTDWIGFLGIVITLALSIAASDFKAYWFLDAVSMATLFKIALIISIFCLIYVIIYSFKHRTYAKIKKVVEELKTGEIDCDW